jgi:hypothetical protein
MKKQMSIYIEEDLIKPMKHKALDLNASVSQYIEDLVREDLNLKKDLKKEN